MATMHYNGVDIHYLGDTGFRLEQNGFVIYLDPTELNKDSKKADVVLITDENKACPVGKISEIMKDDTLYHHHSRHGDAPMKILKEDILEGEWPFNIARVKHNQKGDISGLYVTNGRVRNLWFEKRK